MRKAGCSSSAAARQRRSEASAFCKRATLAKQRPDNGTLRCRAAAELIAALKKSSSPAVRRMRRNDVFRCAERDVPIGVMFGSAE